ncbi:lytic transglycosylase domain-containing protein [Caminibacter sp.]
MRFILIFLPFFLFAEQNLALLLTKPKSYVRDFYLTEFMRETNNSTLAFKAYYSLYKPKTKHLKILSKFTFFKNIYQCVNPSPKNIRNIDIACILNNGLWLRSIAKLNKNDLKYLYNKLPDGKVKSAVYAFLNNDFSHIFKNRDLGYYFILNYPKKIIDQSIDDFSPFEDKYFYLFVKSVVVNNLPLISLSLSRLDYKKFDDRVKWWLFLNQMKLQNYDKAKKILKSIKNKKSREWFWLWKLSGKKYYVDKLLNNPRVNFYTLYAHEEYNVSFDIRNKIIYNTVKKPEYNETDPWSVLKFFDDFKRQKNLYAFARSLDNNKTEALKALVLDKAHKFRVNYFITPKMYEDKNISFKAFVYAIARQESRFIPASVSRSYALGTMQIMPFLVRSMKGDVFKQFDYTENVRLGVKHLKWLFSKLNNPLFVAYAYNGGIGFTKRRVIPKFQKGKYEPFLAMELVPYDESREYGKKVIANYVIYSHIFGDKNLTLHKLIKNF